jgi:hypothetical protein
LSTSQERLGGLAQTGQQEAAAGGAERAAFGALEDAAASSDPASAQAAILGALSQGGDSEQLGDVLARVLFRAQLEGQADQG